MMKEFDKALLFAVFLITLVSCAAIMVLMSIDPVVIGTECRVQGGDVLYFGKVDCI